MLSLANCHFAHDSLAFAVLLRFCDAQSGRSFHPVPTENPSGMNSFEINDIQEEETWAGNPDD
jgi:hypothetical protein